MRQQNKNLYRKKTREKILRRDIPKIFEPATVFLSDKNQTVEFIIKINTLQLY